MDSKDKISVHIDLGRGVYRISVNDREDVITKPIYEGDQNNYDKEAMNKRRKAIMGKKYIPTDLLAEMDPVLYDALEELDALSSYETNYRTLYLEAVTKQVTYTGLSEKRSSREKRARQMKVDDLEKAGISIQYDLNLLGNSRNLRIPDIIRGFMLARNSKKNGANVKVNAVYKPVDTHEYSDYEEEMPIYEAEEPEQEAEAEPIKIETYEDTEQIEDEIRKNIASEVTRMMEEEATKREMSGTEYEEGQSSSMGDTEEIILENGDSKSEESPEEATGSKEESMSGQEEQNSREHEETAGQEQTSGEHEESKVQSPEATSKAKTQPKQKKTISRCKAVQASKKSAREAARMKNAYKQKIASKEARDSQSEAIKKAHEEKVRRSEEAARKQAELEAKQREEANRRKEAERAKKKAEEQAQAQAKKPLIVLRKPEIKNISGLVHKFTRKVKGQIDSIRNKVHIPKDLHKKAAESIVRIGKPKVENVGKWAHKLTRKVKSQADSIKNKVHIPKKLSEKIVIGAAVGACCLTILGITTMSKNDKQVGVNGPGISDSMEVDIDNSSSPSDIEDIIDNILNENDGQESNENIGSTTVDEGTKGEQVENGSGNIVETPEETEKPTQDNGNAVKPGNIDNDKKPGDTADSSVEYLSSIKVGARINIGSGRYFEAPDGSGKSGSFESFKDSAKVITIIGISTYEGYTVIKDSDVNLYELKQQYPNAKFSYHIVAELPDGSTRILGWMTENSFEQNIEHQQEMEEQER